MSISLAMGKALHASEHNLESIFHVMLFTSVFWKALLGQKISTTEWGAIKRRPFTPSTQNADLRSTAMSKVAMLRDEDSLRDILSIMRESFNPIKPLIQEMCLNIFIPAGDFINSWKPNANISHEILKGILKKHYIALPDVDRNTVPNDLYDHVSQEEVKPAFIGSCCNSHSHTYVNNDSSTGLANLLGQQLMHTQSSSYSMSLWSISRPVNYILSHSS